MTIDEVLFHDIANSLGDRAFPVTISREGKTCTGTGLTKRELYAAMAMQGLLRVDDVEVSAAKLAAWAETLARYSTAYADALIVELSK